MINNPGFVVQSVIAVFEKQKQVNSESKASFVNIVNSRPPWKRLSVFLTVWNKIVFQRDYFEYGISFYCEMPFIISLEFPVFILRNQIFPQYSTLQLRVKQQTSTINHLLIMFMPLSFVYRHQMHSKDTEKLRVKQKINSGQCSAHLDERKLDTKQVEEEVAANHW
jgi:hypothetical protein